ncbi:hypothetical protein PAXRUDRAFT_151381 [Paxillus rubicundulus Ve08.2h10]|uniref:Uncharacterized protein n=1 Tax=Paxillus rubicundulus Ve08.2h10 TaxID=930991 RepID=A0A0D0DWV3_9AGAM|nr:hypothetical protein PAXRUDRAFT_151381 [Paxillus rubicundulus Ve08.2h10]
MTCKSALLATPPIYTLGHGEQPPLAMTRQRSRPLRDGQREPARTAKWHNTDDT